MTNRDDIDASEMMVATERINTGLLNNHIFFLTGMIDEYNVEDTVKWIIYENTIKETEKVLTLYINTDGGVLTEAFALIDIMRQSNYPIRTVGIGCIASAGFLVFACGTKGQRVIAKNTSIMCHQYSGGMAGKQHDIEAFAREMKLTNERIINILSDVTKLDAKNVVSKLLPPSDVWLTPEELVKYGVADIIS
ncbi:ATP-dependent Clp protease proteolytic subunit [Candidatus Dojkabacteria bacterium]|jgi:ATP-dependent Clp protease protease subunit|nr:ATP-dependent Clp protease proteolytic subunit [Candidatus Dojkabacteria bacterium]